MKLGTPDAMGRIQQAADYAARQYGGGRVRFYVALVGLGVLAVSFAVVAVVYARADVPDADEAVAAGLVGAVACPAVAVWGVHRFSGVSARESLRKTSPLLVLAALLLVGLGLWQMAKGNGAIGVRLMLLAVADVGLVVAFTYRGSNRSAG